MRKTQEEHISIKCKPQEKERITINAKHADMSISRYLVALGKERRLPAEKENQILVRNAVEIQQAVNVIRKEIHKLEPDIDKIESVLEKVEGISWEN